MNTNDVIIRLEKKKITEKLNISLLYQKVSDIMVYQMEWKQTFFCARNLFRDILMA